MELRVGNALSQFAFYIHVKYTKIHYRIVLYIYIYIALLAAHNNHAFPLKKAL